MSTPADLPSLPEPRERSRSVGGPGPWRRWAILIVLATAVVIAGLFQAMRNPPDGDGTSEAVAGPSTTTSPPTTTTTSATTTTLPGPPVVVVDSAAEWRYVFPSSTPGGFAEPSFDDSSWNSGPGPFGFGETGLGTVLDPGPAPERLTAYFRHSFVLVPEDLRGDLTISVLRDDGVAVFLNGIEVVRDNLPDGELTAQTYATSNLFGPDETAPIVAVVPRSALREGTNVLAVELHQNWRASPDMLLDLSATAGGP